MNEYFKGEPFQDDFTAVCEVVRRSNGVEETIIREFSWGDAKHAGLTNSNVWGKYPKRMLQMRARGFALRDGFPDVLAGIAVYEEQMDILHVESQTRSVSNGKPDEASKKGVKALKDKMTKKPMDAEERLAFCHTAISDRYGFTLHDSEGALNQYCQEKHQLDAVDLSVDQLRAVMQDIKSGVADPCIGEPVK